MSARLILAFAFALRRVIHVTVTGSAQPPPPGGAVVTGGSPRPRSTKSPYSETSGERPQSVLVAIGLHTLHAACGICVSSRSKQTAPEERQSASRVSGSVPTCGPKA